LFLLALAVMPPIAQETLEPQLALWPWVQAQELLAQSA
jgi:hypothetical protein